MVRLGADCASGWGQSLLSLVENTTHDSFELYYGLFLYNPVRVSTAPQGLPVLSLGVQYATQVLCINYGMCKTWGIKMIIYIF